MVLKPSSLSAAVTTLEKCIAEVREWLLLNYLSLNATKTEVILLGRKRHIESTTFNGLNIDGKTIMPSQYVRDLGVLFDSCLMFDRHITKVCRTAFCNLHLINRLSRSLDLTMRIAAINALVLSHIEFCATLLYGLPTKQITKLEHVMRAAFRCIRQLKKYTPISHLFKAHQWLTAQQRVSLHTASLTYKIINYGRPSYLAELLTPLPATSQRLRSVDLNLLMVPRTKSLAGDRAFSVGAIKLWNSIPHEIRMSRNADSFRVTYMKHLLDNV
jgi:hypothetical protein